MFGAITIYTEPHCGQWKQLRFPKSKKRRIQKKWAKQNKNFGFEPQMYQVNERGREIIIAHPFLVEQLRQIRQ